MTSRETLGGVFGRLSSSKSSSKSRWGPGVLVSKSGIIAALPTLPGLPSEEINEPWDKFTCNRFQGSIESLAKGAAAKIRRRR